MLCCTTLKTYLQLEKYLEEDELCVSDAKAALTHPGVVTSLAFIRCNYGKLPSSIDRLVARDNPFVESVGFVHLLEGSLKEFSVEVGRVVEAKFHRIMKRNPGWEEDESIVRDLLGNSASPPAGLSPMELASFEYCPLTFCEVERSLSQFRNIFMDNRHRFTEANFEKYVVVNCNISIDKEQKRKVGLYIYIKYE